VTVFPKIFRRNLRFTSFSVSSRVFVHDRAEETVPKACPRVVAPLRTMVEEGDYSLNLVAYLLNTNRLSDQIDGVANPTTNHAKQFANITPTRPQLLQRKCKERMVLCK